MRFLLIGICLGILLSCSGGEKAKDRGPGDVDTDNDGWTDRYEEQIGTNPYGPDQDSDKDGIPDVLERRLGTNEHDNDSDDDGIPDGKEDPDKDGLPTWFELKTGTNPGNNGSDNEIPDGFGDQDEDGLIDFLEFAGGTDPFKADTDEDGLDDWKESNDLELDGTNPDSDGDGIKDGDDPFYTPNGCTDTDTNVRHAYNSCINATYHTLSVRYYIRRCPGEPDQVFHVIEKDVPTGQLCDESPSGPPRLEDVQ